MRLVWLLSLVVLLAGCAATPRNPDFVPPIENVLAVSPDQAVVVIGYRKVDVVGAFGSGYNQPVQGAWVSVDQNGRRNAKPMPWFNLPMSLTKDTRYVAYTVPAGIYALGWVSYGNTDNYSPTVFQNFQTVVSQNSYELQKVTFSDVAQARPNTPVFVVGPDEVVYVGDLVLDFSKPKRMNWSFERNDDKARSALASSAVGDRLTMRLLQRADGAPVPANDGVDMTVPTYSHRTTGGAVPIMYPVYSKKK